MQVKERSINKYLLNPLIYIQSLTGVSDAYKNA